MTTTVAEMSVADLRDLIDRVIEEKLEEILGDPDAGLRIRPEVREQLVRQMARVRDSDFGVPLSQVPD